jgi:hypothetical protein
MNARMALVGMVLLLVAACSQRPTPIPEFVADEEYAVYHDLLIVNKQTITVSNPFLVNADKMSERSSQKTGFSN